MQRKHLAVGGVFTIAVASFGTAMAIALSTETPDEQPSTVPAGQVEQVVEEPVSTTSVPATTTPPPAVIDPVPVEAPAPADSGDTGDMNQPVPADQVPDVAPGNPAGDYEQRPAPAPAAPTVEQPVDEAPSEVNQPPAVESPAEG